ncbi:MAG: hypothetical protein PHU25_13925 [Deltaproteobacteria bacterium]|nr:hypothetical protein [Deltaproteobacteria bacterium]
MRTSILIIPVVVALAACSTGAGDGEVRGSVSLPDCGLARTDWNMGVDFFAASYYENTLAIRLQNTGQDQAFSDGLLIMVRDVEFVSKRLGEKLTITVEPDIDTFVDAGPDAGIPVTTHGSPARATLYLNDSCPGNHYGFTDGEGELTLDSIYVPDEEKRVAGSFKLRFVDPRSWKSSDDIGPHAELEGDFDFNYARGSPAQTFP